MLSLWVPPTQVSPTPDPHPYPNSFSQWDAAHCDINHLALQSITSTLSKPVLSISLPLGSWSLIHLLPKTHHLHLPTSAPMTTPPPHGQSSSQPFGSASQPNPLFFNPFHFFNFDMPQTQGASVPPTYDQPPFPPTSDEPHPNPSSPILATNSPDPPILKPDFYQLSP